MTKGLTVAALGLAVAFVVNLLVPAIPLLTVCVVLGVIYGNLLGFESAKPGLTFAAKKLLRVGIVLLGLKLSLIDIAGLGWLVVVLIVVIVVITFFATWGLGRLLKLPGQQPLLIAAGFSICGVSAIGAMSGATRARESDTATPIALVTLCGTLAIAVLPLLAIPLGLTGADYGMWVGASVHDVGQVVATSQIAGATALAVAVVVKLTRVLLLAPMVALTGLLVRSSDGQRPPVVPLFIVGFVAAVLLRSFVPIPPGILDVAGIIQTALLGLALVGLGSSIRIRALARTGARAAIVGLASWTLVATLGLGLVALAS